MTVISTPDPKKGRVYQILTVSLLSLNFGIVCFDRNALNYLMPFVGPEMGLTNAQIGLAASSLSLSWSIAAFAMGRLSDRLGRRKMLLIVSTLLFSLFAFSTGLATSFAFILCARLLMGMAEGGVLPLSHAIVAADVAPEHRGVAQAITQNVGSNLFGSVLAPVLLAGLAAEYGWRHTFFLAGLPGVLSAVLIWVLIRETPAKPVKSAEPAIAYKFKLWGPGQNRNVSICIVLGALLVGYLVIFWAFIPLYLTEVKGIPARTASWMLAILGVSAALGSFVAAGLSDSLGRRPVIALVAFSSIALPLTVLWFSGPLWLMGVMFFCFGWGVNGLLPLVAATVPSESVDPRYAATVIGLCAGSGELVGGVIGPILAGLAADATSPMAPLWIAAGLAVIAGCVALALRETVPSRRRPATLVSAVHVQ